MRVEAAWRLGKWDDLEEILNHVSFSEGVLLCVWVGVGRGVCMCSCVGMCMFHMTMWFTSL